MPVKDDEVWECKPCDWFIYGSALNQHVAWGIQEEGNFKCPECKGQLVKKEEEA